MKKFFTLAFLIITMITFSGCDQESETTYTAKIIDDEIFIYLDSDSSNLIGPFEKQGEKRYNFKDGNGTHSLIIQSECLGLYTYDYIMMSNESVNVCELSDYL